MTWGWCATIPLKPLSAPHVRSRLPRLLFTPQDIGFRWGAKRYDMRPANPSDSWNEKYRILVQNSVSEPYAPRNCKLSTQTTTPCLYYTI